MAPQSTPSQALGSIRKDLKEAIRTADLSAVQKIVLGLDSQEQSARSEILSLGLLIGSQNGKVPIVQYLLSLNADPNYVSQHDTNRPYPLVAALEAGNDMIVQLLLQNRADPSIINNKGKTMLMLAKTQRSADLLLNCGVDVDSTDRDGRTALMQVGQSFMVDLLVKHHASLDLRDKDGYTALYIALKECDDDTIAKRLILNKADIEASDNAGRTILDTAVWKRRVEILKLLKQYNVDFTRVDERGRNVLHHLASDKDRSDENGLVLPQRYLCDKEMLDILLSSSINPDARDNIQRTCLHWAAAAGNSSLIRQLLTHKKKPSVNAIEHRQMTPLHLAAARGHTKTMEALFEHGAEVNAISNAGWTPLHAACDQQDSDETVCLLLQHNADPSRKTRSGKTALHIAAQGANEVVVRLLLQNPKVDRSARDSSGNTPLLSAALALHRVREELEARNSQKSPPHEGTNTSSGRSKEKELADLIAIQSILAPWNNGNSLRQEAKLAAQKVQSTIFEFDDPSKRMKVLNSTVYDLLYRADAKDTSSPYVKTTYKNPQSQQFRWVHLPANNISWCQDLLTKYFIERESQDVDGFKDLERSFNHQHRGQKLHSHYMTPTCQIILQPWRTDTPVRTNTTDSNPDDDLLETHVEDAFRPVRSHYHSSPTTHAHDHDYQMQWHKVTTNKPKRKLNHIHQTEDAVINHMYVFMPYIHCESVVDMRKMHRIAEEAYTSDNGSAIDRHKDDQLRELSKMSPDEVSLRAHLNRYSPSIHMRRTLDQSFYHNLNTSERDSGGQVVHRYQRDILKKSEAHQRVLMVDQLWIWVLNDELVISSFPRRWDQPLGDSMNVLESIKEYINSNNQGRVRSVHELAMMITSHCSQAYHRHGLMSDEEQFLDMFEASIGNAMDREVSLFTSFDRLSDRVWRWMQSSDKKKPGKSPAYISDLLNINNETTLLKEIKDIHDELQMLDMIFSYQAKILPAMQEAIESISEQKNQPRSVKQRYKKAFEEQKRAITHPREDIDRMARQVLRLYNSIKDILDLKQKHANAVEARYSREQAESASKQAESTASQEKTVMVFTLVTVIFLPLSFITSFLAIDVSDFPKDEAGDLPIRFVVKYTFGIGLPIATIAVILALYIGTISAWLNSYRESASPRSDIMTLHQEPSKIVPEIAVTRQVSDVLPNNNVNRRTTTRAWNRRRLADRCSSSVEFEHKYDGSDQV